MILHLVAQVAHLLGETLLGSKISNNMVHYYIKVNNSCLTQFNQFQIEDAQCFPVKKGSGETVLIGSHCDGVTCDPVFNRKSFAKNLDKILGMIQDADLPLDLGVLFVYWVTED